MSEPVGVVVLDAKRVQHIASGDGSLTLCGDEYAARDLFWDTTTRIHCRACLAALTSPGPVAEHGYCPACDNGPPCPEQTP